MSKPVHFSGVGTTYVFCVAVHNPSDSWRLALAVFCAVGFLLGDGK